MKRRDNCVSSSSLLSFEGGAIHKATAWATTTTNTNGFHGCMWHLGMQIYNQPSREELRQKRGDGNLCQKFGYCSPMSKRRGLDAANAEMHSFLLASSLYDYSCISINVYCSIFLAASCRMRKNGKDFLVEISSMSRRFSISSFRFW